MKLCIPNSSKSIGGPQSFLKEFTRALEKHGHSVSNRLKNADVLFVLATCPIPYVVLARRQGIPIVQRLDGVYHPGLGDTAFITYRVKNLVMQLIHNHFADQIVYQSEFSRSSCEYVLGHPKCPTHVIHNGVPVSSHLPEYSHEKVQLLSVALWRRADQLEPIIRAVKHLPSSFHLSVYGPHTVHMAPLVTAARKLENITWHGPVAHSSILEVISLYDMFLFSDQSACPNSVIEALAGGLPVVAFDRGGIRELVEDGKSGAVVSLPPHNPWHDHYSFTELDTVHFAEAIQQIAHALPQYKKRARELTKIKFDLDEMINRYINVLQSVL